MKEDWARFGWGKRKKEKERRQREVDT